MVCGETGTRPGQGTLKRNRNRGTNTVGHKENNYSGDFI